MQQARRVLLHLFEGGKDHRFPVHRGRSANPGRPLKDGLFKGGALPGEPRKGDQLPFPHARHRDAGPRVQKDGAANPIFQKIIMGKKTERCLDAANDDRYPFEGLPKTIGEDDDGPVRPDLMGDGQGCTGKEGLPSHLIQIFLSPLAIRRIIQDQRVHRTGNDGKKKPGSSQHLEGLLFLPGWGLDYPYGEAECLQRPFQESFRKRGVIRKWVGKNENDVKWAHFYNGTTKSHRTHPTNC